ncbi:hypothetical protein [Paraburkholderia flagellata]|uniref:hypothetical protein n=1 Tax=Paraburkholderia flagellata TaxID=2883241 RepID=UPI001F45FD96|nr:hypothetical protein [Paraburkholderia flagellata]
MTTYTDQQALDRAVEIIKAAVAAGAIGTSNPANMSSAEANGKKVGEFLGSAVEALRDKLKSL